MTPRPHRLVAATLGLLASTAFAQATPVAPDCTDSGVWFGTIGKARVSMSFSDGTGRYYYGDSVMDLVLTRDPEHEHRWLEADLKGRRTGALTLACAQTLQGTWTNPAGEHAQPVSATPFVPSPQEASEGDDPRHAAPVEQAETDPDEAAVDAYLLARKAHPPAVRRIAERIGPHRFVRYGIHDFGAVSVELQGNERGIPAINQALLPKYAAALDGAWACRYWLLAKSGPEAVDGFRAGDRVVLWHGSTVVIESWTAGCIRDTQVSSDEVTAFDTVTGKPREWPFPMPVDSRQSPPSPLMAAVARYYGSTEAGRRPGCADFPRQRLVTLAWPEQDGLVVTLARAGSKRAPGTPEPADCNARLTLPFDEALPLLPDDHRKLLADLLAMP